MDIIPFIRNVYADDSEGSMLHASVSQLQRINDEGAEKFPWKVTISEDMNGLDSITNAVCQDDGLGFGTQCEGTLFTLSEKR